MVQGLNPSGGEVFCTFQTSPGAEPGSYTMGTISGKVKRLGHGVDHPLHFSKGKVIPLQAQRVGRGIALLFHDRGTRRG